MSHETAMQADHDDAMRDATKLIEEQRAAIAALIEALRPFAHEWTRKSKRYEACGSDWHMRMPGEWPVDQVTLKVGDFRNASALIAKHAPAQSQEPDLSCLDDDPSRWCVGCGATVQQHCTCGPIADNN